jgi:peroxiredoxin
MIETGGRMPDVKVWLAKDGQGTEMKTGEYFAGRRIALFGVPGAFTPTCSKIHLPGYIEQAEALRAAGIDAIACVSVNDPYVMAVWGEISGATGKVDLLADSNGDLARALGLEAELGGGLGKRCRRFAAVVEGGEFQVVAVEPARGVNVCGAEHLLEKLGARPV